jgi:NAD(P)H-hydrate epimerase
MRSCDAHAIETLGIPAAILMEDAARAAFETIRPLVDEHCQKRGIVRPSLVFLCGSGNNGGDGFVLARHFSHIADVRVYWTGAVEKMSAESRMNFTLLETHGILTQHISSSETLENVTLDADCIIDALIGNGGSERLRGIAADILRTIREHRRSRTLSIAIDIPTGLNGETGKAHEDCFRADYTVTMAALKTGLLLNDAPDVCGRIITVPIGIPASVIEKQALVRVLEQNDVVRLLPQRPRRAAKHDFGSVAVIGGTQAMAGAPALSANACISAGAGLVRLYAPHIHGAVLPEVMTHTLPSNSNGAISRAALPLLREAMEKSDVLALGPGLGADAETLDVMRELISSIPPEKSVVIDADGLRALRLEDSLRASCSEGGAFLPLRPNIVLTPHRGEFARLTGCDYETIPETAQTLAPEWAKILGCTLLLKNVPTIISNGAFSYWNMSGNAGMATAGSGDVLTGIIAAILAQGKLLGIEPLEAAALGAYIHGRAGDLFAAQHSQQTLTASGLIGMLGAVFS